jgi:cobalamin synthase
MVRRVLPVVYLVIGLLVAAQHSYLSNLTSAARVLSAVLAVVLWPLVLLGIHLTIK